jgi:acetylglutamate kinase
MDRYHMGDFLFLQALARALARRSAGPPALLCHGSGEIVERLLEGRGLVPHRAGGRLVTDDAAEAVLFDRGMRETARKLTGILTDAVISAVAVSGADRALLAAGEDGSVRVGGVGWLRDLMSEGVVPVVAATARVAGVTAELPMAPTLAALAEALGAVGVAFFSTGGRLPDASVGEVPKRLDVRSARDIGLLGEPEVAAELHRRRVTTYLVTPHLLRSESPSGWVRLEGDLEVRNGSNEPRNSILP